MRALVRERCVVSVFLTFSLLIAGRIVPVDAEKGLPLGSFVALWQLLLVDNSFAAVELAASYAAYAGFGHGDEQVRAISTCFGS